MRKGGDLKFTSQSVPDIVLIEPTTHGDNRGYFIETFRQDLFEEAVGYQVNFIQDVDYIISYHPILKPSW